jgi:hypothetical protein
MFNLKQKKFIYLGIILLSLISFLPLVTYSAGLVPCGGNGEKPCNVLDVFYLVARVTNWLLRVAGIYAVYKIVNISWNFATSQGEEEVLSVQKKAITNVVVGFCLTMIAFMLINTVVNLVLVQGIQKCKVDLRTAWTYLSVKQSECQSTK